MANSTAKRTRAWNKAFSDYRQLETELSEAPKEHYVSVRERVAGKMTELLATPAPTFIAVQQKLQLLWQVQLKEDGMDNDEKRLIVQDVFNLIIESAAVLGLEPDPFA